MDISRLQTFRQFELLAHSVVEGFVTGLHKSPFKGFAIEFEEHRIYTPGDDLKHIDWKLLGKLNRLYIKQYEEDTSLRGYLVVDTSGSMGYASGEYSKLDYARYIAGVLGLIMVQQQDAVGLVTCDTDLNTFLPPRSTRRHLRRLMDMLSEIEPRNATHLSDVLHKLADRIRRRALVVIISDLFDDPEEICLALNHFAHRRNEIIVFQVLDRREADFPFQQPTRFESLEGDEVELVDPIRYKREYKRLFEAHQARLRRTCFERRIDLIEMYTDQPFETAMAKYLADRLKRS